MDLRLKTPLLQDQLLLLVVIQAFKARRAVISLGLLEPCFAKSIFGTASIDKDGVLGETRKALAQCLGIVSPTRLAF